MNTTVTASTEVEVNVELGVKVFQQDGKEITKTVCEDVVFDSWDDSIQITLNQNIIDVPELLNQLIDEAKRVKAGDNTINFLEMKKIEYECSGHF